MNLRWNFRPYRIGPLSLWGEGALMASAPPGLRLDLLAAQKAYGMEETKAKDIQV